jgi:hypothetical protein
MSNHYNRRMRGIPEKRRVKKPLTKDGIKMMALTAGKIPTPKMTR